MQPQPVDPKAVLHDISPPALQPPPTKDEESSAHALPMSIDQIYLSSKKSTRENHWRNNPYAAGLVEPTWKDEFFNRHQHHYDHDNHDNHGLNPNAANGPNRSCCADATNPEMDPTCGCLVFSGLVCGNRIVNAGRVGNMVILKESHVMVDEVIHDNDNDSIDIESIGDNNNNNSNNNNSNNSNNSSNSNSKNNNGAIRTRKVSKRQIDLIIGPYWPMMMFVTYPLIFIVSGLTAFKAVFVPNYNLILVIIWSLMTFGLCFSLFNVAFKDPGILPKYKQIPMNSTDGNTRQNKASMWRWVDKAQSFVPRGAAYDPDCAVVVEEFDHTCPWTGTAIGKKNMFAFQCFIGFLFSCLILDIILLTSSAVI